MQPGGESCGLPRRGPPGADHRGEGPAALHEPLVPRPRRELWAFRQASWRLRAGNQGLREGCVFRTPRPRTSCYPVGSAVEAGASRSGHHP